MTFWDGTRWVREAAPRQPRRESPAVRWAATALMLLGIGGVMVPLGWASARTASATCTLSDVTLEGTSVIQVDASGLKHGADYVIRWVEPLITQTQYRWSTSRGTLQQTVLNNQGNGTYRVDLFLLARGSEAWTASCSLTV